MSSTPNSTSMVSIPIHVNVTSVFSISPELFSLSCENMGTAITRNEEIFERALQTLVKDEVYEAKMQGLQRFMNIICNRLNMPDINLYNVDEVFADPATSMIVSTCMSYYIV